MEEQKTRYTAFGDGKVLLISAESLQEVATKSKQALDEGHIQSVFIFNDMTGAMVDLEFQGTIEDVLGRVAKYYGPSPEDEKKSGPGRPKLGVTSREVSLLPRHWDWLNAQSGGASSAIRKLVDEARKKNLTKDTARMARDVAYKFMTVMAGNLPGFEEASRQYFRGDFKGFWAIIEENAWPTDIAEHLRILVDRAIGLENLAKEEGLQ